MMSVVCRLQEVCRRQECLFMCFISEFTCRIVTYAEELVSIYICYSTGEWFNTPLSVFITSTPGQCV